MPPSAILKTEGLCKDFRGILAVDKLNFSVNYGQIHALIGPNGAGKTTVFNLLTGFIQPTRGKIFFEGREITRVKPAKLVDRGMTRSFQVSATFPSFSVLENVRIALQARKHNSFRFWQAEEALESLNERATELLREVELAGFSKVLAGELSYGQKRVLEIATTLATEPKLMLLDEPTQGMGHEDVGRITALIKKVSKNRSILMVEHNLQVVEKLADQITVLQRGSILSEGTYREVSQDPKVMEAYLGTQSEGASREHES